MPMPAPTFTPPPTNQLRRSNNLVVCFFLAPPPLTFLYQLLLRLTSIRTRRVSCVNFLPPFLRTFDGPLNTCPTAIVVTFSLFNCEKFLVKMLPYHVNPYINSKGIYNPLVMDRRAPSPPPEQASAPQASVFHVSAPQASAPQMNHAKRSGPPLGPSGEGHHVKMTPGETSVPGPPARKRSRLGEFDTANKEAGAAGSAGILKRRMDIQNVPSQLLLKVFKWQVNGENTAVTVRELASLVLVSKEFRTLFHPELIREGIRHAARTKNRNLLKDLCPKAQTLNFPAWDFTSCKARNVSLPPVGAPLHEAAGANDALAVGYLLAAGADPNFLDCRHETALHRAAKSAGSFVLVQLAKAGGNLELRNLHLWTPFDIAIASKNLNAIYSLWRLGQHVDSPKDPTGSSPVHKAIDTNCLLTLEMVLRLKPKLNVKDWAGATPLIYAIRERKSPGAVEMIMKFAPSALVKDRAGKTALFYTQAYRDAEVRNLFARYYCGPAFNKGLMAAKKMCYRRYETTPRELSFTYHY